jgi:hypothetical protein
VLNLNERKGKKLQSLSKKDIVTVHYKYFMVGKLYSLEKLFRGDG